ncbi:hypothetical protein J6A31_05900 [bacterium]|nr:hypothetical protein [bacterium]
MAKHFHKILKNFVQICYSGILTVISEVYREFAIVTEIAGNMEECFVGKKGKHRHLFTAFTGDEFTEETIQCFLQSFCNKLI